jgi:flagellin
MGDTQGQVSSGLRVEQAADNAAYWSIGTTMRSDNKALGAVTDAINLGSAKVDVAYAAMEASVNLLDEIKSKLVAASEPGVDRAKVQKEIDQLQDQLQSVVDSASFNGQNWLSADGTSADVLSTTIVSGFTRNAQGGVELQTLDVDLSKTVLLNEAGGGLLQTAAAASGGGGGSVSGFGGLAAGLDALQSSPTSVGRVIPFTSPFTVGATDNFTFTLTETDGLASQQAIFQIDRGTVDQALGSGANGLIYDDVALADVLREAIRVGPALNAIQGISASLGGANEIWIIPSPGWTLGAAGYSINGIPSGGSGGGSDTNPTTGVMDMDITQSGVDLDDYIDQVEVMLQSTTDAAADLGAIQSRLEKQSAFTVDLMDSLESCIGTLVDADMNEASTRLKALQTQQQLSIQALSIANSSSQSIMQLFQ